MPDLVDAATDLAREHGFEGSCTPEVGRLLRVLVAQAGPGNVGEIGTGCGVGAAWMLSGLRSDQRFFGIEHDAWLCESAFDLCGAANAWFLLGDWREVLEHGPFSLLFVDVADAKDSGVEEIVGALAVGGMAVLDDFTPRERWPESWRGGTDERREKWLRNPRLVATEILTTTEDAAILATRVH